MTRRSPLAALRQSRPVILPSLLLCDFGNLEREVMRLGEAGISALHLDVMDGNFVPNLTYGMPIVEAVRRLTPMTVDVHLMISQPERYVEQFHAAGADILTVHIEATADAPALLNRIKALGMGAGIALNPATRLTAIEPCLDVADMVLVMSVPAGFGGQAFHAEVLDKVRDIRSRFGDRLLVEMDGGINDKTIRSCAAAGAGLFVVGSAIFRSESYGPVVRQLAELATVT